MPVIIHDPCPNRTDHPAPELSDQAVIALTRAKIIRIHPQLRTFYNIPWRRLHSFRHKDRFMEKILQQTNLTFADIPNDILPFLIPLSVCLFLPHRKVYFCFPLPRRKIVEK